MTATLTLSPTQQLDQRPSPELIAYASLLALPAIELEQALEREVKLNPALERVERSMCPFCGEPRAGDHCFACARPRPRTAVGDPSDALLTAQPQAGEVMLAELRAHIDRGDLPILEYLIGSLDERGFLDASPEDISAELEVPLARLAGVLEVLRQHGPPGIAARDLRECLLLQLDLLGPAPEVNLARQVVRDHLELLAAGHWSQVAEALGVTSDDVVSTADFIRMRLRPSAPLEMPGQSPPAPPVLPDVIIVDRYDASCRFAVELAEPRMQRVVLAPAYVDIDSRRLSEKEREQVDGDLARAQTFLRRLDRRWQTMRAVAEIVVRCQTDFLLHGPRFISPLTRADVAAELGVHESTVSRATHGRYVLLPSGRLMPFSCFFDAAQGPCAALAQLVADELSPRSDAELAEALARMGFRLARRTVAKYRAQLGIPVHTKR